MMIDVITDFSFPPLALGFRHWSTHRTPHEVGVEIPLSSLSPQRLSFTRGGHRTSPELGADETNQSLRPFLVFGLRAYEVWSEDQKLKRLRFLQRDKRPSALVSSQNRTTASYRTTISHHRDLSKPCDMEPRKLLPLPKILRRRRSDIGIGPVEDQMEVDPAVILRASESTPDLGIPPTTSGLSTPDDQEFNGMRTGLAQISYLTIVSPGT